MLRIGRSGKLGENASSRGERKTAAFDTDESSEVNYQSDAPSTDYTGSD